MWAALDLDDEVMLAGQPCPGAGLGVHQDASCPRSVAWAWSLKPVATKDATSMVAAAQINQLPRAGGVVIYPMGGHIRI